MAKRPKVVLEFPDELREGGGKRPFLSPFLLGIVVALVLVLVPLGAGIVSICHETSELEVPACPRLVIEEPSSKERTGLVGLWKAVTRRKTEQAYFIEVPSSPPTERCVCEYISKFWKRQTQQTTPQLCIPEIVRQEASLTNEPPVYFDSSEAPDAALKKKFQTAFTAERLEIPVDHQALIRQLGLTVLHSIDDWEARAAKVPWGGDTGLPWYSTTSNRPSATDLERLPGGSLYYSYLRIMHWPPNLHTKFPFKLCAHGCDAHVALNHTLHFRHIYQPWKIGPAERVENSNGCIYAHGLSPALVDSQVGSHAVVWVRPGRRVKHDPVSFTRVFVNSLERAVVLSLQHSHGRVGKFNVVVDGTGFSFGLLPGIHHIQTFVTILQDHFPDRLGLILLTNLGMVGEFVVKLFLPLITEEVRNKISVLPSDPMEQQKALETVVGRENIPLWLGGHDEFEFDVNEYYHGVPEFSTNSEAQAYRVLMSYHA